MLTRIMSAALLASSATIAAQSVVPLENVRTLQDPLLVISNGRIGLDRLTFGR